MHEHAQQCLWLPRARPWAGYVQQVYSYPPVASRGTSPECPRDSGGSSGGGVGIGCADCVGVMVDPSVNGAAAGMLNACAGIAVTGQSSV